MKIYIDTREQEYRDFVKEIAKIHGVETEEKALPFGDYESSNAICERKTVDDLYSSVMDKRLFKQNGRTFSTNKQYLLLIIGRTSDVVQENMFTGIIASEISNIPNLKVVYIEDRITAITFMIKWFKQVEKKDGIEIPKKIQGEVLVSKALGVSIKISKQLIKKYGNLLNIILAINRKDESILKIKGIGNATLNRMYMNISTWKKYF